MTATQTAPSTPPPDHRERVFKYGDETWADPGPEWTNEAVRKALAETIAAMRDADIVVTDLDDGRQQVEFIKRAGTKGVYHVHVR